MCRPFFQSPLAATASAAKKQNAADPLNNVSSPYRGKNYKLLKEMITMAAVRAYRSELRISGDRYTLNWLEKFVHRNDAEGGPNLKVRCGVRAHCWVGWWRWGGGGRRGNRKLAGSSFYIFYIACW